MLWAVWIPSKAPERQGSGSSAARSSPTGPGGRLRPAARSWLEPFQKVRIWGSFRGAWGVILGRFRADIKRRPDMGVDSKKLESGGPLEGLGG